MQSRSIYSIVALSVMIALAISTFTANAEKRDGAAQFVPRWEHLALTHNGANVTNDDDLSRRIVGLGDEGWELVSVSTVVMDGTTVKTVFYFKRPKV